MQALCHRSSFTEPLKVLINHLYPCFPPDLTVGNVFSMNRAPLFQEFSMTVSIVISRRLPCICLLHTDEIIAPMPEYETLFIKHKA